MPRVPGRLRRDRRPLMVKIRVVAREAMPRRELLRRVEETIRTGMVARGIEIHWLDWAKGKPGRAHEGRVDGAALEELQKFYAAINKAGLRVERAE